MPSSQPLKTLSVRLPESEIRRLKTAASTCGISIQEAVHQALKAWASKTRNPRQRSLDALEGSLADVDIDTLRKREKELELREDQHWH